MLVGERTSIANRMKATLVRFGITGFEVTLKKAPARLAELRGPEGVCLPPNTQAELRRDMARLQLVREQLKEIERTRLERLAKAPREGTHPMMLMLAMLKGIGIETADVLVHEILSRNQRDRRGLARYAGVTGSPDESGSKRREKGLARAGNARVRRSMIQLAWRWLMFQKQSARAQWFEARTVGLKGNGRKTMIVALARKLLIALWRYVTSGEVPEGAILRPAA
jgi:transposase